MAKAKAESKTATKPTKAEGMDGAKKEALKVAIQQIRKDYGEGSIMRYGSDMKVNVDAIPTGALSLDIGLGIGGVPKGRIIEIFGPESSGKTTLALHIVAEAQKRGGIAAFIDAEHALDPGYAKALGVDIDNLYLSQPDFGEQALEILETLIRSGAVDVIVIDSVAALTPRAEIEGEMGDSHMGLQARLMSQALRKITAIASRTGTTVIFLNQIRMKIGVMFGNPETTTGGNALKFYASVRMDIRSRTKIMKGEEQVGSVREVKIVKNKVAPPFKTCKFDVLYGVGIDRASAVIDSALQYDILQKSGAWIKYGDENLAQGLEKAKELLRDDTKLLDKIEGEVREKAGIPK
ncbi:recombinase RecA [Candidatus Dojkabacteria bacterium]|uniref:Protein RecA n=1 Tax=Candidatus Dojkabacteria bacterium TaxID=2099670 RepID=A0A955L2V6_9BACT|nr:recombinase RecA [Candidatus Dojkabacteria bacterium]